MSVLPDIKTDLRRASLAKRRALPDRQRRSELIALRLVDLPLFRHAQTVFCYVGLSDEVHTLELVHSLLTTPKQVVVPYCEDGDIHLFYLERGDELEEGAYGILEPKKELRKKPMRTCHPSSVDLYIIPGVAFDPQGNRIGHGAGYFDRLLGESVLKPGVNIVALAFDCQLVKEIPASVHDIPVQTIVMESGIVLCRE